MLFWFIVIVIIIVVGVPLGRRQLEELGHRKDARDAAFWHAVAEPRNRMGNIKSTASRNAEAYASVRRFWAAKAKPHVRDRNSAHRAITRSFARGQEPKLRHIGKWQHANESIRHINNMWRGHVEHMDKARKTPRMTKAGEIKPGIRRSTHPHVTPH